MNLSLIIFIIGVFFVVAGYSFQIRPQCKDEGDQIKYVPMSVYEEIENSKPFLSY